MRTKILFCALFSTIFISVIYGQLSFSDRHRRASSGLLNGDNEFVEFLERLKTSFSFIAFDNNDDIQDLDESEHNLRLPKSSIPLRYNLHLQTNIHNGDLLTNGDVSIHIRILESTDRLTLHSRNQTILNLEMLAADQITTIDVENYTLYSPTDMLTVYLQNALVPGSECFLKIRYSFDMRESSPGFYRTSYRAENGADRYLAATQFEPVAARYVLPLYDEPLFKAVFEVRITHTESYHAISNTDGVRDINGDGTVTTTFAPSPIMSSYLLAFVVSDFSYISNEQTKAVEDTLHRIYVRPYETKRAQYALENSEKALKELEKYVDYKYELSKVDSAAIPAKGGAMENWGLVTYREEWLIFEEDYDNIAHIQRLDGVSTIAHELAHQFFGNSVTCEWWSYIWLNEGFATLFEYEITDKLHPDWRMRDFFNLDRLQIALKADSIGNLKAMTTHVETLAEISGSFSFVAYHKAGSVLRMFQNAVGDEIFRDALRLYIKLNDHLAVTSNALHEAFDAVLTQHGFNEFNFTKAFQTWELQPGYPIVHVSYDDTQKIFRVTQKHYATGAANANVTSSWFIPLNFATARTPNFDDTSITHYLEDDANEKIISTSNLPGFSNTDWFVFNKQQLNYYRVNYDAANWQSLITVLNSENFGSIHPLNRAQLVNDVIDFAENDLVETKIALDVLKYLRYETDYAPWAAAFVYFNTIDNTFKDSSLVFNQFMKELSHNFYNKFAVTGNTIPNNEQLMDRFGRESAIYWSCKFGNENCLTDTYNLTASFANQNQSVPRGLENVIYCNGLRGIEKKTEWIRIWRKMRASVDSKERQTLISALGCSDDAELMIDFLDSSGATNSDVDYSRTERLLVFNSVMQSSVGLPIILQFIDNNELEILYLYEVQVNDLLDLVSRNIKNQDDFLRFVKYLASNEGVWPELLGYFTKQANSNLEKQEDPIMIKQINVMDQIIKEWEIEVTTTTTTASTTTSQITTTERDATTMGSSSLTSKLISVVISLAMSFLLQ